MILQSYDRIFRRRRSCDDLRGYCFKETAGTIQTTARRLLGYLDDAEDLRDLLAPPGNRLEALRGAREGQYSIRINDQYRICFRWEQGKAKNVEIVDYH